MRTVRQRRVHSLRRLALRVAHQVQSAHPYEVLGEKNRDEVQVFHETRELRFVAPVGADRIDWSIGKNYLIAAEMRVSGKCARRDFGPQTINLPVTATPKFQNEEIERQVHPH